MTMHFQSAAPAQPQHALGTADRLEERVRFDQVRYANCWEDADVLCAALQPQPGQRVLSIASAGDNALALLAEGAEVVAADLNPAQLACLELRCAAFRRLDYADVLAFLGVRACDDRLAIYRRLEDDLTDSALRHWRDYPQHVQGGIIHAGRFERYFHKFRQWVLPLIHSRRAVTQLLADKPVDQQHTFYDRRWNNWRWQVLFRLFFGRLAMGRLGRDPEFFRHVEGSVADRLLTRVEHGLRNVPPHTNPYLTYILTGNFQDAMPRYLQPHAFEGIRSGLDRLTLHHGPIEQAARAHAGDGFDAFNLSDIFEYLDRPTADGIYADLLAVARPGARLAYWNTLVPRQCPEALSDRVESLDGLAAELHARDRAFFYCHFHVDHVHPIPQGASSCAASPSCS